MRVRFGVFVLLFLGSLLAIGETANILAYFTTFSKSHLIIHMAVAKTLVDRGHNVTIVTTLPLDDEPNPQFRHIKLDVPGPPKEFLTGIIKSSKDTFHILKMSITATTFMLTQSNATLHDPKMKKLMAEDSFDLVILGYFFNDFQIGVAAHFKCPLAISFMQQPVKSLNDMVGNPVEPLYVPHMLTGKSQPLSFFGRVQGFLVNIFQIAMFSAIDYKMHQYYDANFPSDKYPSFEEMRRNTSLLLVNHHMSMGPIRPNVPAVIEIGGIQLKPEPDPLPQDLQKFLDGASKTGAIYFCLGSNARSADMNPETISIVYKVLSNLKQKIIWKWEDDEFPGNSSNILFKKWLPQSDILAHPNIKLFVTHGGYGGVVESQYRGVPMVGMPLFADQFSNMKNIEIAGYGINLGDDITEERFSGAVREVLENSQYRDSVQRFSKLYRDRPMSARDTAAFWLEYVIRHRGAPHMQSPAVHMNAFQYYGLDVIGFLLAIIYVTFKILKFVLKKIACVIFRGKCSKKQVQNKNKKNQ